LRELRYYKQTIEEMQARGFELAQVHFGLGRNGRQGIDLYFTQQIGGQVQHALVEVKGVQVVQQTGLPNLKWDYGLGAWEGSPKWNADRLLQFANENAGTAEATLALSLRAQIRANPNTGNVLSISAFNNPGPALFRWQNGVFVPF
jgi:hypothetical protein